MSNFSYLSTRPEYSLFANSAIEAEKVFSTSPEELQQPAL